MIKKLTLKDLGAEYCHNILQPIRCECGCGGYANLIIKDEDDYNVFTVAGSLLEEIDCTHAWVFVLEGWSVSGAYTTEDDNGEKCIKYFSTAIPENEEPFTDFAECVEFTKSLIEEIEPHCIGVLQLVEGDSFRVVDYDVYDKPKAEKVIPRRTNRYFH